MKPEVGGLGQRALQHVAGSAKLGDPSGSMMSQNIRAVPGLSPRQGSTWNVEGSGLASMSAS